MSNKPLIEITGFAELKEKIMRLSDKDGKKRELLNVLRIVARPTVRASKQFTPVADKPTWRRGRKHLPGGLKKSIGNITGKQENPTVYVGPRTKGTNDGWYGHFVHNGHNIYQRGFKRRNRKRGVDNSAFAKGRTMAFPFMRQAYELTGAMVTADAEKRVANYIQNRINKLSR